MLALPGCRGEIGVTFVKFKPGQVDFHPQIAGQHPMIYNLLKY